MEISKVAHPDYAMFKQRLESFTLWPPQLSQKKTDLAHAGLFYSNVSDRVTCFACGVMLYGWKPQDDPWIEHYHHTKRCVYLNMVGGVRLLVHDHGGPGCLWAKPKEVLARQSTTPPNPLHGAWTHAGMDEPDVSKVTACDFTNEN